MRRLTLVLVAMLVAAASGPGPVVAQDKPRPGGELIFVVPSEPPTYDGQHRIIPHSSKVRGWTITPAHFLNQQLDTVWLAE